MINQCKKISSCSSCSSSGSSSSSNSNRNTITIINTMASPSIMPRKHQYRCSTLILISLTLLITALVSSNEARLTPTTTQHQQHLIPQHSSIPSSQNQHDSNFLDAISHPGTEHHQSTTLHVEGKVRVVDNENRDKIQSGDVLFALHRGSGHKMHSLDDNGSGLKDFSRESESRGKVQSADKVVSLDRTAVHHSIELQELPPAPQLNPTEYLESLKGYNNVLYATLPTSHKKGAGIQPVNFTKCNDGSPFPSSLVVDCSSRERETCALARGSNHTVSVTFTPLHDSSHIVSSLVNWRTWVEMPLPAQDRVACNYLHCPLVKGMETTFTYPLNMPDYVMRRRYSLIWRLTDAVTHQRLLCFSFRTHVT